MKCPHCLVQFHDDPRTTRLGPDPDGDRAVMVRTCPSCKKLVIELVTGVWACPGSTWCLTKADITQFVRPKAANRPPVPPEVPASFAADYREACLVIADSPKASAALSRRCLQHVLREKGGMTPKDLVDEVQQVIDSRQLPSHLAESLDAVRNIGNFAAHPIKSKSTGEIVEVEPGEAEWNLDVLEELSDFYFVRPAILKRKKDALNKKLSDAGKPLMK